MFDWLHAAFHKPRTRVYRVVENFVWFMIIASIAILMVEPFVPERLVNAVNAMDVAMLVFFAAEVTLRIATVRPAELELFQKAPLGALRTRLLAMLRYAMRPMILIDIVTVLALVPALRGLRALRLLRLLRTVKLFRYANPFQSLTYAFERDRLLFTFAFTLLAVMVTLGGVSFYLVERGQNEHVKSVWDGLWWAIVTITTVGYGDIFPKTAVGRSIAGTLMVGGMFMLALFAGVVGHTLLNAILSIREESFRMSSYVNHIVVCGYEEGSMLLDTLQEELDEDTRVVVFGKGGRPRELNAEHIWVTGDPTKESELDKVRLPYARAIVVAGARSVLPQNADANTILTIFTIRAYLKKQSKTHQRRAPVHVIAEVLDEENVAHARTAGADEVIETRLVGSSLLAHAVAYPGIADVSSRLVLRGDQNFFIGSPPDDMDLPMSFEDTGTALKKATGALLVGVRNEHGELVLNPSGNLSVHQDAHLIYISGHPVLDEEQ